MSDCEPLSPNTERVAVLPQATTTDRELRPTAPAVPNYSLAKVCPACDAPVYRHACKVRCTRCGFMWDCSEL